MGTTDEQLSAKELAKAEQLIADIKQKISLLLANPDIPEAFKEALKADEEK